jgi:hypothetical protein
LIPHAEEEFEQRLMRGFDALGGGLPAADGNRLRQIEERLDRELLRATPRPRRPARWWWIALVLASGVAAAWWTGVQLYRAASPDAPSSATPALSAPQHRETAPDPTGNAQPNERKNGGAATPQQRPAQIYRRQL